MLSYKALSYGKKVNVKAFCIMGYRRIFFILYEIFPIDEINKQWDD
jgi:hypothetical protein